MAARMLRARGVDTVILEASDRPGGRLDTRQFAGGVFDLGAQFLTARDWRFREVVQSLEEDGLVRPWSKGFPDARQRFPNDRFPRLRGLRGLGTVARQLADGLGIRFGSEVKRVSYRGTTWEAVDTEGVEHTGASLIVTLPLPAALALIDAGNLELPAMWAGSLRKVSYHPTLAVLAMLDGPAGLPEPGALQLAREPIDWIADNHHKGISPRVGAVTVHAAPEFSRVHWSSGDDKAAEAALDAVSGFLKAKAVETQVHRWEFGKPVNPLEVLCASMHQSVPLVFAGSAFSGGRIEGMALSGLAAADAVASEMKVEAA
jgi:hypothetical protein